MQELSFNLNESDISGPLELILTLLSKHKIKITDINISDILRQYMEQIEAWQKENLDVSSEFLEMASRLVYIKTQELLPKPQADNSRDELISQLMEYKACKEAAEYLKDSYKGGVLFVRRPDTIPDDILYRRRHHPDEIFASYQDALGRGKRHLPPKPEIFTPIVVKPVVSVSTRIIYLMRSLFKKGRRTLSGIFGEADSKSELIATFLAVLELFKAGRIASCEDSDEIRFVGRKKGEERHRK